MVVDGKKIRDEIKSSLNGEGKVLDIVYVGENPVIDVFVRIKKKFGENIGVKVNIHRFDEEISFEQLKEEIKLLKGDGIIIQLPLPEHLPIQEVLNLVPAEKDIDVLSDEAKTGMKMSPVAGAVFEIFERYKVDLKNKKIVMIGKGRLVGEPVAIWLRRKGIDVSVLCSSDDIDISDADIVISGVGSPNLITPNMIKEGVVLIDAGTSAAGGKTVGDIHLDCEKKAGLFSPVPGGVGPITVAMLFENLTDT